MAVNKISRRKKPPPSDASRPGKDTKNWKGKRDRGAEQNSRKSQTSKKSPRVMRGQWSNKTVGPGKQKASTWRCPQPFVSGNAQPSPGQFLSIDRWPLIGRGSCEPRHAEPEGESICHVTHGFCGRGAIDGPAKRSRDEVR